MKVLHIINSLTVGGAEKLLVDSLPTLTQKGVETTLLVLGSDNNEFFVNTCKSNNIPIIILNKKNIYSPLLVLVLKKIIRHYDLVHVHLFPAQYWVAAAARLLPRNVRPILVTTEHSVSNRRRDKWIFKYIDRLVYAQYQSIICVSTGAYNSLDKYLSTSNRMLVIENGIELKLYHQAKAEDRSNFGFIDSDIIVTMVAGFRHEKDQDTLIRSMSYLPNRFKLLLVGQGVRQDICKKLCRDLNLENRIVFAGLRHNVPEIFKMSNVCVMSSHWEGLCLVAVEAMAAGKVVVASNVNGLLEIVKGYGLLFERGDDKTLSQILINLDQNKKMADEIAQKCLLRSEEYSLNTFLDKTIALYNELLQI